MSLPNIPLPKIGQIVHATAEYSVRIDMMYDEGGHELIVYGIINNATGVREAELRGCAHAIQWANKMQLTSDAITGDSDLSAQLEAALMAQKE